MLQVYDRDANIASDIIQGAAATIFINDGNITQAFLSGHGCLEIEVENPTTARIVIGLLSCYFTFNRSFPAGYEYALNFLCNKIFMTNKEINSQHYVKYERYFNKSISDK